MRKPLLIDTFHLCIFAVKFLTNIVMTHTHIKTEFLSIFVPFYLYSNLILAQYNTRAHIFHKNCFSPKKYLNINLVNFVLTWFKRDVP